MLRKQSSRFQTCCLYISLLLIEPASSQGRKQIFDKVLQIQSNSAISLQCQHGTYWLTYAFNYKIKLVLCGKVCECFSQNQTAHVWILGLLATSSSAVVGRKWEQCDITFISKNELKSHIGKLQVPCQPSCPCCCGRPVGDLSMVGPM